MYASDTYMYAYDYAYAYVYDNVLVLRCMLMRMQRYPCMLMLIAWQGLGVYGCLPMFCKKKIHDKRT